MTGQHKHDLKEVLDSTCILVFGHKRHEHISTTLKALSSNPYATDLPVRIYVDAPRDSKDDQAVQEVIRVSSETRGFKACRVIASSRNQGLYNAITTGISDALNIFEQVIVVEDDIKTSAHFLEYMLNGLKCYRGNPKVASIHGYTPKLKGRLPETFFLRGADCWGWATWKDRWDLFRADAGTMAEEIIERGLAHEFNLMGAYQYLEMLEGRARNENNSWAICWHASCFLANMYTLYPGRSLVENIGLDGSGEHCFASPMMETKAHDKKVVVTNIPVEQNKRIFARYCRHFAGTPPLWKRAIRRAGLAASEAKSRIIKKENKSGLVLLGPYSSFEQAKANGVGYDSPVILEMVTSAVSKVLRGEGAYERDGTVFEKAPMKTKIGQVLANVLIDTSHVADFGGGLGGLYVNYRAMFGANNKYTVIEQENFVRAGEDVARRHKLPLEFCSTLEDVTDVDILIMSSVLQYIPNQAEVISAAKQLTPQFIIIDRTAIAKSQSSAWWLQYEKDYYGEPVSYPIKPVILENLLRQFTGYSVVDRWVSEFDPQRPRHIGILLQRST